jgi:hypothetical protein
MSSSEEPDSSLGGYRRRFEGYKAVENQKDMLISVSLNIRRARRVDSPLSRIGDPRPLRCCGGAARCCDERS